MQWHLGVRYQVYQAARLQNAESTLGEGSN